MGTLLGASQDGSMHERQRAFVGGAGRGHPTARVARRAERLARPGAVDGGRPRSESTSPFSEPLGS